jgi:hypothetical protein
MTMVQPATVLAALKATANPRKQRNLDIVHDVCDELHRLGSRDFSTSTVGRKSQQLGGVSKDALYNRSSIDYRTLIGAWADWSGKSTTKSSGALKPLKEEGVLLKIPDPAVRAIFGGVVAERNRLRSEINVLKANAEIVIDRRVVPGLVQTNSIGDVIQVLPAVANLTATERETLRKAISREFLDQEGWREGANGEIVNERGRVLFDLGFIPALRKLIQA